MTFKIFRRGSARCIGLLSMCVILLICVYYISIGQHSQTASRENSHNRRVNSHHQILNSSWQQHLIDSGFHNNNNVLKIKDKQIDDGGGGGGVGREEGDVHNKDDINLIANLEWEKCVVLEKQHTNITTMDEYEKFDFQPEWMKTKEYWDKSFEAHYEKVKADPTRPPLKVILVPHSHNDPGWLKTFFNYFQSDSRQILNLIVTKMQEYKDMTFIWSEISFLQLWWDQAHPTKQRALKQLIKSGRFEITTGGWVMTDEANVHLYAMVDQLIEGHQWVKTNLNITPEVGWSIDPFGHGSTFPYILAASELNGGAIIQRIHYAWKKWFAEENAGDFIWTPYWNNPKSKNNHHYTKSHSILTHNMPFDIYSIKHSCGPHPFICLNFDFRKIPGEYTEYSIKAQFITDENIEAKSNLLLEQYSRTASLLPHNVALIPIGDDFRYNKDKEIDQQYLNYKKLITFINNNKDKYKTDISFGTPKDYFVEIKKRFNKFPRLKGDFFVYADIFTEGRPAYWSGYFTTRPSYKLLSRELENQLRSAEILFTLAFNFARQENLVNPLRIFEKNYEKMIIARRNLGLFQHHDAITGTSKANVMRDYGIRLFESIQDVVKMQELTIEVLIQKQQEQEHKNIKHNFILSELERDSYTKIPKKTPITLGKTQKSIDILLFNSLANERHEIILLRTKTTKLKITDLNGYEIPIQINPVWNVTSADNNLENLNQRKITVSDKEFEIMFIGKFQPLSLVTFTVTYTDDDDNHNKMATLYCNDCKEKQQLKSVFDVRNKQPGDIQLENYEMRLLFDEQTGFLKSVTKKNMGKPIQCAVKISSYRSAQFHSGAYLLKTDTDHNDVERDVLEQYITDFKILITSGPLASDVTAIYGPFLAHTVRIFNTKTEIDKGIYVENDIDFEPPPKNRETELFIRFQTDIENGDIPEIYTDLNGFQYQYRKKVPSIGIEGNYFPITTGAFIQDSKLRLSVLTTHAQGAASLEPGQLEIMLDRRTLYDDYRGMGEGVVDSRLTRHKFWLLFETIQEESSTINNNEYQLPSILSNYLSNQLNYPTSLYYIDKSQIIDDVDTNFQLHKNLQLLKHNFPCDVHLLNLRTLTDFNLQLFPSNSALFILQRQGYNCKLGNIDLFCSSGSGSGSSAMNNYQNVLFKHVNVNTIQSTSLTGTKTKEFIENFSNIYLEPMEIRTFNLTF